MSKPILEKCINELSKISFFEEKKSSDEEVKIKSVVEDLKQHIDKRFIDFLNNQQNTNLKKTVINKKSPFHFYNVATYTITVKFNFPKYKGSEYIEVRSNDTVTDVFDEIWYKISDYVEAFTYMESWILKDYESDKNLVIREVSAMIPASFIFRQDIIWQADKLMQEYKGSDSSKKNSLR